MFLPTRHDGGFTLLQLLITLAIAAILAALSLPAYDRYIRHTQLQAARAALLENAHFLERFYQQHKSFKQNSTTWPTLPITETDAFCIRLHGVARGLPHDKFTLKAVAFDQEREPRVLKINEALTATICETTINSCDDDNTFFKGQNADKKCRVFN